MKTLMDILTDIIKSKEKKLIPDLFQALPIVQPVKQGHLHTEMETASVLLVPRVLSQPVRVLTIATSVLLDLSLLHRVRHGILSLTCNTDQWPRKFSIFYSN